MKPQHIETDALIIGAGPVGLFQVFQLGLLEVKVHVVDALPYAGGQCVELYPEKPIYDIPSVTVCTGQELTGNLLRQIAPFGATFHFGQEVSTVVRQADGRWHVETSTGATFLTKTIFIAAGVGAFQSRSLQVEGADRFKGDQLFYRVPQPAQLAGKHVVIVGGEDAALECALALCAVQGDANAPKALSVTLLHRRDVFKAQASTVNRVRELCASQDIQFIAGQITGFEENDGVLTGVKIVHPDASSRIVPLDVLLVFLGLSPKLGPIAHWGLDMNRKQLTVDTEKFSTREPGIFAVGDINTYPGKKKLILCGFHECTLAAYGAMPIIAPEKNVLLQYTTTSPKLHKILGVEAQVNG